MSKTAKDQNRVRRDPDSIYEMCESCDRETPHSVSIKILQESTSQNQVEYSREPYRISVCDICESTEQLRMNDQ